jgi:hypothetical protein
MATAADRLLGEALKLGVAVVVDRPTRARRREAVAGGW